MKVPAQVVEIRRHRRQGGGLMRTETWLFLPVYLIRPGDQVEDPRNQAGWTVEVCEPWGRGSRLWKFRAGTLGWDMTTSDRRYWTLKPENVVHYDRQEAS